jgi:hypothetical protein
VQLCLKEGWTSFDFSVRFRSPAGGRGAVLQIMVLALLMVSACARDLNRPRNKIVMRWNVITFLSEHTCQSYVFSVQFKKKIVFSAVVSDNQVPLVGFERLRCRCCSSVLIISSSLLLFPPCGQEPEIAADVLGQDLTCIHSVSAQAQGRSQW